MKLTSLKFSRLRNGVAQTRLSNSKQLKTAMGLWEGSQKRSRHELRKIDQSRLSRSSIIEKASLSTAAAMLELGEAAREADLPPVVIAALAEPVILKATDEEAAVAEELEVVSEDVALADEEA